jgi:uncharacterized membrane protein
VSEEKITADRLAAYSDAVFAVIVTIMVLELKAPEQAAFSDLWPLWPTAISYAVSYLFIAIIWINHYYLWRFVGPPTLGLIWINFIHLFLVSLLPFATSWIARTRLASSPVVVYAGLFVCIDIAYSLFEHLVLARADATQVSARSDAGQIKAAVDKVVSTYGGIDILVNNAFDPSVVMSSIIDLSVEQLQRNFDVGPIAYLRTMQACYPHLKVSGEGRVINFASLAGIGGLQPYGPYNLAKEAVRALTRTAAREWGADKITVNNVLPVADTWARLLPMCPRRITCWPASDRRRKTSRLPSCFSPARMHSS